MAKCNMLAWIRDANDGYYSGNLPCELEINHEGAHAATIGAGNDDVGLRIGNACYETAVITVKWTVKALGRKWQDENGNRMPEEELGVAK